MNLYYVEPSFSQTAFNPYNHHLPYTPDWIMLKILETIKGTHPLLYDLSEISRLVISKENAHWEYQLFDFVQYQTSHHKNIILAADKKDLDSARSVYRNHSYTDKFLRPYEQKILLHTTTKENYKAIMRDGHLRSWNVLKNLGVVTEEDHCGHMVGDAPDNSDYVMFTNGGLGAERVVASKQKGTIDLNFDNPYIAGARFYFDADKIAKDGLLVRDGRQMKVRDHLNISKYLLWIATPEILGIHEETTPRIFAEKANAMFQIVSTIS